MDEETGKWVPCAKVKDTKANVTGLKKGSTYQFRVKAVNKEGASDPLQTDHGIVAKNPYDVSGKPGKLHFKAKIRLSFNKFLKSYKRR